MRVRSGVFAANPYLSCAESFASGLLDSGAPVRTTMLQASDGQVEVEITSGRPDGEPFPLMVTLSFDAGGVQNLITHLELAASGDTDDEDELPQEPTFQATYVVRCGASQHFVAELIADAWCERLGQAAAAAWGVARVETIARRWVDGQAGEESPVSWHVRGELSEELTPQQALSRAWSVHAKRMMDLAGELAQIVREA